MAQLVEPVELTVTVAALPDRAFDLFQARFGDMLIGVSNLPFNFKRKSRNRLACTKCFQPTKNLNSLRGLSPLLLNGTNTL